MTSLASAMTRLRDATDDVRNARSSDAQGALERLVAEFDAQPIRALLTSTLPEFDLEAWWKECAPRHGFNTGKSELRWPRDLPQRVSCQLAVCRRAAQSDRGILDFAYSFIGLRGSYEGRFRDFVRMVVEPLVRDTERLAELREVPPILDQILAAGFPASGDQRLDELLSQARAKFREKSPVVRKEALERLWDAWERLKTLLRPGDKKESIRLLLERAAPDVSFRDLLEKEAKSLTDIGNSFQIRHFEQGKHLLIESRHVDYLFHRLSALVLLLLQETAPPTDAS